MPVDLQSAKDAISGAVEHVKGKLTPQTFSSQARDGAQYLGDLATHFKDNITTGLAGTAISGGASALMTRRRDGETDEQYRRRLLQNTAIGAGTGAAAGTALGGFIAPAVRQTFFPTPPAPVPVSTTLERAIEYSRPSENFLAAGGAAGGTGFVAGNIVDRMLQGGIIDKRVAATQAAKLGDASSGVKAFVSKGPVQAGVMPNKDYARDLIELRNSGSFGKIQPTGESVGAAARRLKVSGKWGKTLGALGLGAGVLAPGFVGGAAESTAGLVKYLVTPKPE